MMHLLLQNTTPWFSEHTGILLGSFGGAGLGALGAILGVTAGILLPQGRGRTWLLGTVLSVTTLGVLCFLTGLLALWQDQPYAVWFPLLLLGGLAGGVFGGLYPTFKCRLREAEQRRLEADALRRS